MQSRQGFQALGTPRCVFNRAVGLIFYACSVINGTAHWKQLSRQWLMSCIAATPHGRLEN